MSMSGVRFIEYVMPKGSLKLVNVGPMRPMSAGPISPCGSGPPSGCPESIRVQSGPGTPSSGSNRQGVWQSLQPPETTSSFPRATSFFEYGFGGAFPGRTGLSTGAGRRGLRLGVQGAGRADADSERKLRRNAGRSALRKGGDFFIGKCLSD